MIRNILILFGVVLAIILVVAPGLSHSNCGGNSAALVQVSQVATLAKLSISEEPDHAFRFASVNAEQEEHLSILSRSHWLEGARFLVTTAPLTERDIQLRRMIVVCDTPYCNVPQRLIGSAPPTHAAGFADGSAELISTEEFAALDLSTFVALDELHPSKTE